MTIAAGQARFLSLTARKADIEYSLMNISQRRMTLSYQAGSIFSKKISTTSPMAAMIQEADKRLELEQKQLETQLKAATAEVDSVRKLVDNNTKKEFKLFS